MKKNEGKVIGIYGTIIIHLIVAICFMSFKINSLKNNISRMYEIEFIPVEEIEAERQQETRELSEGYAEKTYTSEEKMFDIARNVANKPDVNINASDYIDMVKEELISSGKLGKDNFIDEQKHRSAGSTDEDIYFKNVSEKKNTDNKQNESRNMASNFNGPTRIYYDLPGRVHSYLPIPIYMCQGSGKVVLKIDVNQKGEVEKAILSENESTASDPCLFETAVKTAMISRFNPDISSPKIQTGTLTYHFVAQ
jgi:hypothetical protein